MSPSIWSILAEFASFLFTDKQIRRNFSPTTRANWSNPSTEQKFKYNRSSWHCLSTRRYSASIEKPVDWEILTILRLGQDSVRTDSKSSVKRILQNQKLCRFGERTKEDGTELSPVSKCKREQPLKSIVASESPPNEISSIVFQVQMRVSREGNPWNENDKVHVGIPYLVSRVSPSHSILKCQWSGLTGAKE